MLVAVLVYNMKEFFNKSDPSVRFYESYRAVKESSNISGSSIEFYFIFFNEYDDGAHAKLNNYTQTLNKVTNDEMQPYSSSNNEFTGCLNRNSFLCNFLENLNDIYGTSFDKNSTLEYPGNFLYTFTEQSIEYNLSILNKEDLENSSFFLFLYVTDYPSMNNYTNCTQSIIDFLPITSDDYKNYDLMIDLNYKENFVYTDTNVLFDFISKNQTTFFSVIPKISKNIKQADYTSITVRITVDNKIGIYDRSYRKLDSIMADSLAIYEAITLLLGLIESIINSGLLTQRIFSSLYVINDYDNQSVGLKDPSTLRIKDEIIIDDIKAEQSIHKLPNLSMIKAKRIIVNTTYCCNNSQKLESWKSKILLYDKVKIGIKSELNAVNIINQLSEYQILKNMILDINQQKLLLNKNRRLIRVKENE